MSSGDVFLTRPRTDAGAPGPSERPHTRLGLGSWISLLILGILLPMSVLAAIATRQAVQSTRDLAHTRLTELSRALASSIDNQLKAQIAALQTLSFSRSVSGQPAQWDVAALDRYARHMANHLGAAVAVFRPDGSQIVNTLLPAGAVLQKTALGSMVDDAVKTRKPAVSDLARSTVTGRLGFGVGVPIERDGDVVAVLAVLSNTSILHEILAGQNLPDGIFASLVDRRALVVARSDQYHTDFAGRRIVEDNIKKLANGLSGRYSGFGLEGSWREFAFTKLSIAEGWALVVGQRADDFNAEAERYSASLALLSIVVIAIGGTLALIITRLIVKPIAALDRYAAALGTIADAERPPLDVARVTQVERLQDNIVEAERRLRANEERFRELLALLDLAIFMARRLDGTILYWSRGAEEFYGWSSEDAIGQTSHTLLKTVFPVPLTDVENALRTHGQWSGGVVHTTCDGHAADMIVQMTITGDAEGHVLEILHDVSDLHRTQRELHLALETGEIGTFLIDLVEAEVLLDERSRKLIGAREIVMTRDAFLALIPDPQRFTFDAALARCIGLKGDGILDVELTFGGQNGEPAVISMRGQAERSAGVPVAIAGVMMDVTRLRQSAAA